MALSHGKNGLTDALRKVCDQYEEVATSDPEMNAKICHLLDSFNPTIVWIQIQNEGITEETLQKLQASQAHVINWTGDVRAPIPDFYFHYGEYVDVTCFSNMHDVKIFNKYGYRSEFLQIGFDPEIYSPEGEKKQVEDIVFMGSNTRGFPLSQYRAQMVQFLKQTYGNRFGVYGNGWMGLESGNYMGDQHGEAAVYRGAKIAINCSHFNYERYSSDRLFRALGCGVCVASHKYKGVTQDFIEAKELMLWDDFDQLKVVVDAMLFDETWRNNIAAAGLEVGKKYFTFIKMCENIVRIYENRNL